MNTYLIPTTAPYVAGSYDHFYAVHANTAQDAYLIAKIELAGYCSPKQASDYEYYPAELYGFPNNPFHKNQKHDILIPILLNTKGFKSMAYFNVNWNDYTKQLSQKAIQEDWSNDTYPNNGILANYLVKTYEKLSF